MKIGYARVSTEDQSLGAQIEALQKAGCKKIFQEKISGTKKDRPELNNLLDHVRPGDEVIVWKLDRLGRSTKDLIDIVTRWQEKGISFYSLSDKVSFDDSPIGKVIFHLMAAFAQLERDLISERTKAGLAHARSKGRIGGRKKGLSKEAKLKAAAAATLYRNDDRPVREIAEQIGVSPNTLYKYLRYMGIEVNSQKDSAVNPSKKRKTKERL